VCVIIGEVTIAGGGWGRGPKQICKRLFDYCTYRLVVVVVVNSNIVLLQCYVTPNNMWRYDSDCYGIVACDVSKV